MGNCGQGGNGGKGSGVGGNGGGGSASGISGFFNPGSDGQLGSTSIYGTFGGDGGSGGGIVMIRAKQIVEINGTTPLFKYFQANGEKGYNGEWGAALFGGQGGNGGNGGDAMTPSGMSVFLPGRGGEAGISGTGRDGGGGGDGGDGGTIIIVTDINSTSTITNDNFIANGGLAGYGGGKGWPWDGQRGNDGAFYDLSNLHQFGQYCHYVKYNTIIEDCECDNIFFNIIPFINSSTLNTLTPPPYKYQFETTTSWTCQYDPSPSICFNGKRLECKKTVIYNDGTNGKAAPERHVTTSKRCDMKLAPISDDIWADLYIALANPTFTQNTLELIITAPPNYEFHYTSGGELEQISPTSRVIVTCCEPSTNPPAPPQRWGDDGVHGLPGKQGRMLMYNEEIVIPSLRKTGDIIPNDTIDPKFDLKPNPAGKYVILECSSIKDIPLKVRLNDLLGNIIHEYEISSPNFEFSYQIDVSDLKSAVYIMQIFNNSENKLLKTLKFTKD